MLTFDQAKAHYDGQTNPRWVACHAALGRRPKPWEFMCWNTSRWRDYLDSIGFLGAVADYLVGGREDRQATYDAWLLAQLKTRPAAWAAA